MESGGFGNLCWTKAFRKAAALPITFRGRSNSGGGGGFDRVGGGVTGMTGNMGGGGGVTGGAGGSPCRSVIGGARGGVGGNCSGARRAARYFATRPGSPGFDGFAGPVVFRAVLLEAGEHALCADGGPERQ